MEFIVRILFTGMLVFIPNEDGSRVDVLLLNVGHTHQMSDGTALADHTPIVLANGGTCTGDCPKRDATIATSIFADKATNVAQDSLEAALPGGGSWILSGSELSLRKAAGAADLPALSIIDGVRTTIIPTTSAEREDFTWVANLKQICPDCGLNPDVLDAEPPAGLIAARFRLTTGDLSTFAVARIGSDVTPVQFKRLDGTGSASSYTQSIASWVGADITVSGTSIELVEMAFDGTPGRSMSLTPDANDMVEIAVLNLPPLIPVAPTGTPGVGKHFERYYDVTATPPASSARLVPQAGAAPGAPSYPEVTWQSVHPQSELSSDLLDAIRLSVNRSAYEVQFCPPSTGYPYP